jgi:hypothetical protein
VFREKRPKNSTKNMKINISNHLRKKRVFFRIRQRNIRKTKNRDFFLGDVLHKRTLLLVKKRAGFFEIKKDKSFFVTLILG